MTRKSKREIETALDALAAAGRDVDGEKVRTWVETYLTQSLQDGWNMEYGSGPSADAPDSGEVCIKKTTGDSAVEFFAPEEDVPDWIDTDDLPVQG